jgi:hypothetical protein
METYSNDLTALAFLHDGVLRSATGPEDKAARQVGELLWRTQVLRPYVFPVEPTGPIPTLGPLGPGASR